jgi:hypothetical protein
MMACVHGLQAVGPALSLSNFLDGVDWELLAEPVFDRQFLHLPLQLH